MGDAATDLEFDFSKFSMLGNGIFDRLRNLRESDPIFWSDVSQGWIVSDHEAVSEAFFNTLPLSAERHRIVESFFPDPAERKRRIGYLTEIFPWFLTNTDPPQQIRLRKLMLAAFSRPMAEQYRPVARSIILETLDGLKGRNKVEFVSEVARQITARVIMHVLGLPSEHLPMLQRWAYALNSGLAGRPTKDMMAEANDALVEMRDVFLEEIEVRKKHATPAKDLTSALLAARDGRDQLTENEVIAQLQLTLIAGHDTTLNTMALSVAALSRHPAARRYMYNHPETTAQSIMELMRYVAMSTSMERIVKEDFVWRGHHLKKDQVVYLMIAGANRDPKIFSNPDALDFARKQEKNMTFAPGQHHCIGHFFAKMQLSEFFSAFLDRYESFEIFDDDIQFGASTGFRGLTHLNLLMHPRVI
jgi:pimeloyl-[acyl-carrier protein] synthase